MGGSMTKWRMCPYCYRGYDGGRFEKCPNCRLSAEAPTPAAKTGNGATLAAVLVVLLLAGCGLSQCASCSSGGTDPAPSSSGIPSGSPAQDQATPATTPPEAEVAPPASSNEASKWFEGMKVTEMGEGLATSWEEFAAQAPLNSVAAFSFRKIGDDRWYKFKFPDGSSINACFKEPHGAGNGLELYTVDIDAP